jgi:hypothetical protein
MTITRRILSRLSSFLAKAADNIPGLPISNAALKNLFDFLDRPNPPPCTHTFKETQEFLNDAGLPLAKTIAWLKQNGAGCDCEVIFNVDAEWGEALGRTPSAE